MYSTFSRAARRSRHDHILDSSKDSVEINTKAIHLPRLALAAIRKHPNALKSQGRLSHATQDDLQRLASWHPKNFTEPVDGAVAGTHRFIIHTVPIKDFNDEMPSLSEFYREVFFKNPEAELLSRDFISVSLFSNEKPGAYGRIGLVLEVPPQNILRTSGTDIDFRNNRASKVHSCRDHFAGTAAELPAEQRFSLEERGANAREIIKSFYHWAPSGFPSPTNILTPKEVIDSTRQYGNFTEHNELLLASRPGVNIYPGLPATGFIKVKGIFLITPLPKLINAPALDVLNEVSQSIRNHQIFVELSNIFNNARKDSGLQSVPVFTVAGSALR